MRPEIVPPVVTVVHAPACHFCLDAEEALGELAVEHRIEVRPVDIDSAEGRTLVALHRPAMSPLVLLDGAFFSSGRLPRKKLARALQARTGATTTGAV
ncbi:glutaredoxin 2 [Cellulomonas flavigena DSM 20109]|uniref:Glutaredoxin 2 n=1 Tax=Cellulomonas flavigena (strain ATCC 482 / DSM 20109 / BCRC 11376 / JCM 18109 / NBRC 3775 / NCIMB 8073 / NRS 134) TaxID=446466 RepID=D5UE68_CELFN|nr:glutaredoxin family protein [Cellulomonas flavigena]ADG76544.1 glutaredoxin 2 [Cellulomonas flavigena DSM 20109]